MFESFGSSQLDSSCDESEMSRAWSIDFDDPPMTVVQVPDHKEQKKIQTNKRLRLMYLNQSILYGVDLINKSVLQYKEVPKSNLKSLMRTTTKTFKSTQVDYKMLMDLLN